MKVTCKFDLVSETGTEMSLAKGDTVQIIQLGAHSTYNVRKHVTDTCSNQEGWVPAYVIGMRGPDESQSRYECNEGRVYPTNGTYRYVPLRGTYKYRYFFCFLLAEF